jgi:hypothetical protein
MSTHSEALQICYPKEINVSRFLAWLLDPSQGHGLGDQAIKSLLACAGKSDFVDQLPIKEQRFLAAANIYTRAFSSIIVVSEAELGLPDERRYIDVLAVDPVAKLYVAIENKFGCRESQDQTASYFKALRKLFPNYHGIHLYLDINDGEPDDKRWIAVNYTWLTDFIAQTEQLDWVAPHVKATMAQFRKAVQEEDDVAEASVLGNLVTHVASQHEIALDALHRILTPNAPRSRAKDLAALVNHSASGNVAKANVRLFQLYCRRPHIWDRCLKERKFARFHKVLGGQFSQLMSDPRRVVTYFSLKEFEHLRDPELGSIWVAAIHIRQEGEHFRVRTYVALSCVKADYREQLLQVVNAERARNAIRKAGREDGNFVIRRGESLPPAKAADDAAAQLHYLCALLKGIG